MSEEPRRPDEEQPHDVLAAEEFAIGTRDERQPPPDPTGIDEPHDVLAAEEFAMPAGPEPHGDGGPGLRGWLPLIVLTAAFAVAVAWVRSRRA